MPIELDRLKSTGRETHTMWNDAFVQDFMFETTVPIPEIRFDPRNWLFRTYGNLVPLGDRDFDGVPDGVDHCTVNLNPDQANLDGDAYGDVCDDADDLVDGLDCAPLDAGLGVCLATGIAGVSYVDTETVAPGEGYAYLVRGYDEGCGGPGSLGWASTGLRSSPCP